MSGGEEQEFDPGPPRSLPLDSFDLATRIPGALAQLPEDCRQALLLVGPGGMSYAEAAVRMGKSEAEVRELTRRACARLATLLDGLGRSPAS